MRHLRRIAAGMAMAVMLAGAGAVPAADKDEIERLNREVQSLKEGQQAIQTELQEIRQMLQQRSAQPARPAAPERLDGLLSVGDDPSKGDPKARVVVVEFSDYQCPYCKRHVQNTLPQLDRDYLTTGKLRYVFRDFPLESIHPQAAKASEAARCAGEQGKYWEMHDRLFENQQALKPGDLLSYGDALGLDAARFKACVEGGKYAGRVREDIAEGQRLGVAGTPTFFIGVVGPDGRLAQVKRLRGAQPFSTFKQEIDALLAPRS